VAALKVVVTFSLASGMVMSVVVGGVFGPPKVMVTRLAFEYALPSQARHWKLAEPLKPVGGTKLRLPRLASGMT